MSYTSTVPVGRIIFHFTSFIPFDFHGAGLNIFWPWAKSEIFCIEIAGQNCWEMENLIEDGQEYCVLPILLFYIILLWILISSRNAVRVGRKVLRGRDPARMFRRSSPYVIFYDFNVFYFFFFYFLFPIKNTGARRVSLVWATWGPVGITILSVRRT